MKLNYVGVVGAILAFVSVALPWWTVSFSGHANNWYLYNPGAFAGGLSLWYNWVASPVIVFGGIIAIAGSITPNFKKLLIGGGILAFLSTIIFAVGLQTDLSSHLSLNVFSSNYGYSTYLSSGFWVALVAGIIMLAATRYPKPTPQAPRMPTTGT